MWKDIKDYEGYYQVSDDGKVRRIKKDGSTRPVKGRNGKYLTVDLCKNGTSKGCSVHRLVAEAFLDRPEGATEVNHIDGDKHNNNVSNLEWVDQKANFRHAVENLKHFPYGKPPRPVNCYDAESGNFIVRFPSIADAARTLGKMSARQQITLCCQGLQLTAYGFRWQYAED